MKQLQIDFSGWHPLPNFEKNYEINKRGDVRNVKNKRLLKHVLANNGYYMVAICINYKVTNLTVHRLLALAFMPNTNNHPVINHIDSNKLNNNLSNLEWCTYSHNNRESFINTNRGGKKRVFKQKFMIDDIIKIRELHKFSVNIHNIAEYYNTSYSTIYDIVKRKKWDYEGC